MIFKSYHKFKPVFDVTKYNDANLVDSSIYLIFFHSELNKFLQLPIDVSSCVITIFDKHDLFKRQD